MPHVITNRCTKCETCKDTCPVGAIATDDNEKQCFINADECIDCGACASVCEFEAIFPEDELPVELADAKEKNAQFYK